jgi:hypothetical protein
MSITQKIFLAALVCCLMGASSMFGSELNAFCTPTGTFAGGVGGPTSESCGSFTTDGGGTIGNAPGQDTITGISIFFVADFQIGLTPGLNQVEVAFANPSLYSWSASPTTCIVSGTGGNSSANSCTAFSGSVNAPGTSSSSDTDGTLNTDAATAFTVAVSSVVDSGAVQTSSGDVIVSYQYTLNSSTPEPATLGLVGSALLGLGLLTRKRLTR